MWQIWNRMRPRALVQNQCASGTSGGVYVHCMYTHMPGESNCRWLTSLLLYLCYIFWALINSLLCYKNVGLCSDKWLASQPVEFLACQNLQLCNFSRHRKCDKSETLLWTRYNHCTLPGHTTFTLSDLDQCYFTVYAELDSFSGKKINSYLIKLKHYTVINYADWIMNMPILLSGFVVVFNFKGDNLHAMIWQKLQH